MEPWTVDEVWIGAGAPGTATHYTDITAALDRKIDALCSHKSQISDPVAIGEMVRAWSAGMAQGAGLPAGRHAEVVRVVNTR